MRTARIRAAAAALMLAGVAGLSLLAAGTASAATGKALIFMGNSPGVPATPTYTGFAAAAGKTIDTQTSLPANLGQYDCIVLSVNNDTFSATQKSALSAYVNGGGRLLALAEYEGFPANASASMTDLASALGSTMSVAGGAFGVGPVTTTNIDAHPFTSGVASIRYGAASRVAPGSGGSSLVRSVEGHTIVAAQQLGSGFLVLSGDHNIFSDHNDTGFTQQDNGKLVNNICNGDASGGGDPPEPPTDDCRVSGSATLNLGGGRLAFVTVSVLSQGDVVFGQASYSDPIALVFLSSLQIQELECSGDEALIRGRAFTNRWGPRQFTMSVGDGGTPGPSGDGAGVTVASYGRSGTAIFGNLSVTPLP